MKKYFLVSVVLLIFSTTVSAGVLEGQGVGPTKKEAEKEALAELSQAIRVEVESEFSSVVTIKGAGVEELKTKAIHLKSDLPLLGVDFFHKPLKTGYSVAARLDSSMAYLYGETLSGICETIRKNLLNLEVSKSASGRTELLNEILTDLDQYYKYRIVAQVLDAGTIPEPGITAAQVRTRLKRIAEKADTIDFGARIISKAFDRKKIFIYPPMTRDSNEATPFAGAVKDYLEVYLDTVTSPEQADYTMTGEYRVLDGGIELTCRLLDKKINTVKTAVTFFLPSAYGKYRFQPLNLDFEKLLNSGLVVSSDFKVDIKTDKGSRDLLYRKGETLRLLVKMNQPGYFYLVSHNLKKEKYSYLVNFTEESGNRKFVRYVNGDEANRWVELGEFEVIPPLGVETLHMIASSSDLEDRVPGNYYDGNTGLYKIGVKSSASPNSSGDLAPSAAVMATRGLMLKKKKKASSSEANITFTSMER